MKMSTGFRNFACFLPSFPPLSSNTSLLLSSISLVFLPVIWHARLTGLYLGLVDSVLVSGDARLRQEGNVKPTVKYRT